MTVTTIDDTYLIPAWEDEVEHTVWLCTVTGFVEQVYESAIGTTMTVVREPCYDPQTLPLTSAVPLYKLRPGPSAQSAWARAARYRISVEEALRRATGGEVEDIVLDRVRVDRVAVVALPNGATVAVGTVHDPRPPAARTLARTLRLLRNSWTYGPVIVATDAAVPASLDGSVVRWRGKRDDPALRNAVTRAAAAPHRNAG
jgi:hypothetical protein